MFVTFIPKKPASQELDASVEASGPHDFVVRKLALSSAAPPASIASQPYVRDDRETPHVLGRDDESCRCDLGQKGTEIFLQLGLDDPNQLELLQQIRLPVTAKRERLQANMSDVQAPVV